MKIWKIPFLLLTILSLNALADVDYYGCPKPPKIQPTPVPDFEENTISAISRAIGDTFIAKSNDGRKGFVCFYELDGIDGPSPGYMWLYHTYWMPGDFYTDCSLTSNKQAIGCTRNITN